MLDLKNLTVVTTDIYDNLWTTKNITLSLLRLDKIDPVISGNKLFKLSQFLQQAINLKRKIITFGGAYSNHLVATAAACNEYGLDCIGVVRGEKPPNLSPALLFCLQQNMQLEFISRSAYNQKQDIGFLHHLQVKFGEHILIPEGGFSKEGANGAAEIYKCISQQYYTHVCCPVGTATTIAGLIQETDPSLQIIGFSALANLNFEERLDCLLDQLKPDNYRLFTRYNFGGYAKKSADLINFMNTFFANHLVPLDFVYTGKMMYGVIDLIRENYFAEKSRIICLHTGGLQGNSSLKPGVLKY